jgi:FkbM family methyltransferase
MDKLPVRSFPIRHRLISFLLDIDIKGIRWLAHRLPKWLMPNPEKQSDYILLANNQLKITIHPAKDSGVERSLHATGTYEKGILDFLRTNLKVGDIFIDVGANIGWISLFASKCVGESGKVYAIEAHPLISKELRSNVNLNSSKNIEVCDFALGHEEGAATIWEDENNNRGGSSMHFTSGRHVKTFVKRLDNWLPADITPKLIKIDVEGFEGQVIAGAIETIKRFRPILVIEFTFRDEQTTSASRELIEYILSLAPYQVYLLSGGKERVSKLVKVQNLEMLPKDDNLIFLPKE